MATPPGPDDPGETIHGQPGYGAAGPQQLTATFPHPTRPGDLLVAALVDGVFTSGRPHARALFPGWTLGKDVVGGNTARYGTGSPATGGLHVAIYFYPDNPGGITSVPVATWRKASVIDATVIVGEIAGAPSHLEVDATGHASSGPTAKTDSTSSGERTSAPTTHAPDLVLAAFTNGGNTDGERFSRPGTWTTIGQDPSLDGRDQPSLFDYEVTRATGTVGERISWSGGYPIDNAAAIVALCS